MNPRYEDWLRHIFDHEVKEPQWYFGEDAPAFEASDEEITELLGQTFLHAGKDLKEYTDEQVDQGIWYLEPVPKVGVSEIGFALACWFGRR